MDNPQGFAAVAQCLVGRVETFEDMNHDARRDPRGDVALLGPTRLENSRKGFALYVFHDEEELTLERDDVDGVDDIWVVKARCNFRFVEEHRDEFGILGEVRMQSLDGN